MKALYTKMIHPILAVTLGLSLAACDNASFTNSAGGGNKVVNLDDPSDPPVDGGDIVFIQDSFERDDIFADLANEKIYGWRGFVIDGAVDVIDFKTVSGAGARIPLKSEFGPAADGDRILLMNGDNDADTETIHVISQSYDLSEYKTAILSFKYLTLNLEAGEKLELQVCKGTLNECGANDDAVNSVGLKSNNWVTVFTNDQSVNDDALNGKNHVLADWKTGLAVIDLLNPEFVGDSSTFVFRFRSNMTDGLSTRSCTNKCEVVEVCELVDGRCYKNKYKKKEVIREVVLKGTEIFVKDVVGTDLEEEVFAEFACGRSENSGHHKLHAEVESDDAYSVLTSGKKDHDDDHDDDGRKNSCNGNNHGQVKVKICHIPSGNPAKAHEICVSANSLRGHKHHGSNQFKIYDYFGDCTHEIKYKKCENKEVCEQICTPGDGTLKDGVGIDNVKGIATQRPIEDIL